MNTWHSAPGGGLSYAHADLQTFYGKVPSHWKMDGNSFVLTIEVPPNTKADVYIPSSSADMITESGKPIIANKEMKQLGEDTGMVILQVGSGRHEFLSRLK